MVYAVWFNMLPGDSRGAWDPNILTDPRVIEYWDSDRILGDYFGEHRDEMNLRFLGGPIVWDASLLFGPNARWIELPEPLEHFGYTIFGERRSLQDHVERIWTATPAAQPGS